MFFSEGNDDASYNCNIISHNAKPYIEKMATILWL